ncbi:MAG: hypothetical protein HUU35_12910 [Armatimonadetes bacterium]|nr:hypothetical protein [Armatimonadota bacterium]
MPVSESKVAPLIAKVWSAPRQKMDTATLLEVSANLFSATVLTLLFGLLSTFIGYISGAAGQSEAARAMQVPAMIVGGLGFVAGIVLLVKLLSGKSQYKDERGFAAAAADHVFSQPSAPNFHFFERVALPGTLGEPGDENVAETLRDWMAVATHDISVAMLAQAGVEPGRPMGDRDATLTHEAVPTHIIGKIGQPSVTDQKQVKVGDAAATVYEVTVPVAYRLLGLETSFGNLTEEAKKLADTIMHTTYTLTVVQTPSSNWHLLDAARAELASGGIGD